MKGKQNDWNTCVIHGKVHQEEIWDDLLKKKVNLYLLFKRSLLSMNHNYHNDYELYQQFQCGKEFDTLDIIKGEGKDMMYHQYVLTKIPSMQIPLELKNLL